jgi:hypothetical protein
MFSMAGNTPDRTLSVVYATGDTATIPESHARFNELVDLLLSGAEDDKVAELVDAMLAITKHLSQLSERVSIKGRTVLFDGDPLRGEIADVLFEAFEAGNAESLRPVLNFLEKASTNPSRQSVDDLYRWVTKGDLVIHEDGDFLAYKAVKVDGDGNRTSINSGTAFVDGEEITGNIPNPDGAVVTMPRSEVDDNAAEACSTGLHAGTYAYAEWFRNQQWGGNIIFVLVKINPRDVVSVPTDSSNQKLRVCRYVVHGVVESRRSSRLFYEQPKLVPEDEDQLPTDSVQLDTASEEAVTVELLVDPVFGEVAFYTVEGGSEDEEDDEEDLTSEEEERLASEEALDAVRQRLTALDADYSASPSEAEVEEAKAAEEGVIRDAKGRFTKESAVKAVRNSKGQFTKKS